MKFKNPKKYIYIFTIIILFIFLLLDKTNNRYLNNIYNYFGVKNDFSNINKNDYYNLVITVIDVGHGDSILINSKDDKNNNHYGLIDTGSDKYSQSVMNVLNKDNIKKLDFIIISHLHSDHMGSLPNILKNYNVNKIIVPNYFRVKDYLLNHPNIKKSVKNKKIAIKNVKSNQKIKLGKAIFEILYPITEKKVKLPKDLNDSSIVGILKYNNWKMMFTGDATSKIEQKILNNYKPNQLKCNVLKLAHHGSKTSTSLKFLQSINPKYAIISSGDDKNIIYPHPDVEKRLKDLNINYYNTRLNGNISIYVSDNKYKINY